MKWYVLQVMTGKELDIRNHLQKKGIKAWTPRKTVMERKNGVWKTSIKLLFPSYVLVKIDLDASIYYYLKPLPGVIKFLGTKAPEPVSEDEIAVIARLTGEDDMLEISNIYIEGSCIKVVSGPLVGLEGKIIKLEPRRQRAKVNISLMGQPRIVEIGIRDITKSEPLHV